MKTFALLAGLAWCGLDSPTPAVAPAPVPAKPLIVAPACTPLIGPETKDTAVIVACDGCRQKYFSSMGLPRGLTFDACVTQSTARVRAKLAADPHYYDAALPKLRPRT